MNLEWSKKKKTFLMEKTFQGFGKYHKAKASALPKNDEACLLKQDEVEALFSKTKTSQKSQRLLTSYT